MQEEQIKQLGELVQQISQLSTEARRIFNLLTPGRRPCGCQQHGQHRPGCVLRPIDRLNPWDGYKMTCCGSRKKDRHKQGCALLAIDGTLPPDDFDKKPTGWDCVKCGTTIVSDDRPKECPDCGEHLLIQKFN